MAAADICLSLRAICSGDSLGSLRIIMCIWSLSVYPADEQRVLFAETFGCKNRKLLSVTKMLQDNSLSFFTERLHAIFDPVNKTRFQGFK